MVEPLGIESQVRIVSNITFYVRSPWFIFSQFGARDGIPRVTYTAKILLGTLRPKFT